MIKEDYWDHAEGELVYQTADGNGVIEEREFEKDGKRVKEFIVKLYFSQLINWRKLSGLFTANVKEMYIWALAKDGWANMNVANPILTPHVYEDEKYREDDERDKEDPYNEQSRRDYVGFYKSGDPEKDHCWTIFENDEEYLFIWRGTFWLSYDDTFDKMHDSSYNVNVFLRNWYDRVMGLACHVM